MSYLSISTTQSPATWYANACQQADFRQDDAQAAAVIQLEQLYHAILRAEAQKKHLLSKWLYRKNSPRGIYLWGGVGRGKSLLMDIFYQGLPATILKRRLHFHEFMQEFHRGLKNYANQADPLRQLAKEISKTCRVLCFDEFHVSDIADAMLLARLITQLLAQGVVLILTSNYPPSGLYPNGLQRTNFLPCIALLEQCLNIIEVNGAADHRRRHLTQAKSYFYPLDAAAQAGLHQQFQHYAKSVALDLTILIQGRNIQPICYADGIIWFSFAELCGTARAQIDYLELAQRFPVLVLSDVPALSAQRSIEARRFTWLIDVLYDQKVKLILSAAVAPDELYPKGTFSQEFTRIASRLTEMQSEAYLQQAQRLISGALIAKVVQ